MKEHIEVLARSRGLDPITAGSVPVDNADDIGPLLIVIIDTEEAFDWSTFDRNARDVGAIKSIGAAQEIFDAFGVVPTYVIDHPIAESSTACKLLGELAASNRAVVGAHLHTWVNPPFGDEIMPEMSYQGNLPKHLEREKLRNLVDLIEQGLGFRPVVHKAGRYGFGPETGDILEELGFLVDMSASPPFDYSPDGGPNYTLASTDIAWMRRAGGILEIPTTGGYAGLLGRSGPRLQSWCNTGVGRNIKLQAILWKTGLFGRLRLSPEGNGFEEMRWLSKTLKARGQRVFVLSFHSPSLEVGGTQYVQNRQDLSDFLDSIRRYVEFFLGPFGGRSTDPLALRAQLINDGAAE